METAKFQLLDGGWDRQIEWEIHRLGMEFREDGKGSDPGGEHRSRRQGSQRAGPKRLVI